MTDEMWRRLIDLAKRGDEMAYESQDSRWGAFTDDLCQWVDEEREVKAAQKSGTN